MIREALLTAAIATAIAPETLAQMTEAETSRMYAAMEMADNGQADRAIATIESLLAAHPAEAELRYELGYALLKDYQFARAAETFHSLRAAIGDVAYQMEGNAQDMAGRRGDAMRTYREGLRAHPASGRLKMEIGTIRMQEEDYGGALEMYRSGIESEPAFTSNYYRTAWILFNSSAPWEGLAYAEAFIVLELRGERVEEMSAMLYEARAKTLRHTAESGGDAATAGAAAAGYTPEADGGHPTLRALTAAMKAALNDKTWIGDVTEQRVRDFETRVESAGHWDAYCRWLMRKGAEEEFAAWMTLHESMMESFALWLADNGDIAS